MPIDPTIGNQLRFARIKQQAQIRRAATKKQKLQAHPIGITLSYRARLNLLVKEWRDLYLSLVDNQLERLAAEAYLKRPIGSSGVKTDSWPDDLSLLMRNLAVNMGETVAPVNTLALDIGQKTSDWNDDKWRKTMISVVGVDLYTQEPWLRDQIKSFAGQNTQLISKLAEETRGNIGQIVTNGFQQGRRVESIRKDILSNNKLSPGVFKKSSTRANLIARDQVAKLNGQLTQLRQEEIGIDTYIFRTSFDERVRVSHKNMNGFMCRWDDATVYSFDNSGTAKSWKSRSLISGVMKHPGQDYQCRCTAEANFLDIYSKEELAGKSKAPAPVPVKKTATKKSPAIAQIDPEHQEIGEVIYAGVKSLRPKSMSAYKYMINPTAPHKKKIVEGALKAIEYPHGSHSAVVSQIKSSAVLKGVNSPKWKKYMDSIVMDGKHGHSFVKIVDAKGTYYINPVLKNMGMKNSTIQKLGAELESIYAKAPSIISKAGAPFPVIKKTNPAIAAAKKEYSAPVQGLTDAQIKKAGVPDDIIKRDYKKYTWNTPSYDRYVDQQAARMTELTADEIKSLRSYSSMGFERMNKFLRGEKAGSAKTKRDVKIIRAAMAKKKNLIDRDMIIKRGIRRYKGMPDWEKLTGKYYEEAGFGSSSPVTPFGSPVTMIAKAPKGTRGIFIKSIARWGGENELLLDHNTRYFITKVVKKEGKTTVYATIVQK